MTQQREDWISPNTVNKIDARKEREWQWTQPDKSSKGKTQKDYYRHKEGLRSISGHKRDYIDNLAKQAKETDRGSGKLERVVLVHGHQEALK
jgi:hypothetical protein